MPYPYSGLDLVSNLVTDYIQKRRGEPGVFFFEYILLPKLISIFLLLHGPLLTVVLIFYKNEYTTYQSILKYVIVKHFENE